MKEQTIQELTNESIKHAIEHYKKRVRSLECKIWKAEVLKLLEKQLEEEQPND